MNSAVRTAILGVTAAALLLVLETRLAWSQSPQSVEANAVSNTPAETKSVTAAAEPKRQKQDSVKKEKPATEKDAEKSEAEEKKGEEKEGEKKKGEEEKEEAAKGVELGGVFEARRMTEIAIRPQSWTTMKVLSAVAHGRRVNRGQLLLALDLKPIDDAIADLRTQNRLTDLSIRQAEIQLEALKATTPLSQASADRSRRIAKENFQHYTKVQRPLLMKSTEFMLRSAKQRLEYQEEELQQLEKMYKADDLTEETEEIVLKRARNSVEMARFMFESAKASYDEAMKYEIARRDEQAKDTTDLAEISWQSTRGSLPLTLKKQQLDMDKMKTDRSRSEAKLDKLLADRAAMVVKAPVDGVLYYGQCDRGKWSSAATIGKKLRLGGSVLPHEVIMTIVQDRPVFVRTTLAEKDLAKVYRGDKCTVVPTGFPDVELAAVVTEISGVPIETEKFDVRVTLAGGKVPASLVPGMTCKVKFPTPKDEAAKPAETKKEAASETKKKD